jgi:hypothetical protein
VNEMAELDTRAKARIASQAQAAAHKELRENHPEEYKDAYQRAKDQLTERAERGGKT